MKKKPTIEELDAILNSNEELDVVVQSDGSITAVPSLPRFRLVQDDSCHWYAIPADKREQFQAWVQDFANMESDEPYTPYEGPDFDEYRMDMHPSNYTFRDLKEG